MLGFDEGRYIIKCKHNENTEMLGFKCVGSKDTYDKLLAGEDCLNKPICYKRRVIIVGSRTATIWCPRLRIFLPGQRCEN